MLVAKCGLMKLKAGAQSGQLSSRRKQHPSASPKDTLKYSGTNVGIGTTVSWSVNSNQIKSLGYLEGWRFSALAMDRGKNAAKDETFNGNRFLSSASTCVFYPLIFLCEGFQIDPSRSLAPQEQQAVGFLLLFVLFGSYN